MPSAGDQPHIGTARRVVDLVVGLIEQGRYRSARMHLHSLELREGLLGVADIVNRLTAPPAGVDPRTETQARLNVPDMLPPWLAGPVHDEIGRICARQSTRVVTVPHLVARILAASIVDASGPGRDAPALEHPSGLGFRVEGRDIPGADLADHETEPGTVLDVSDGRAAVHVSEPTERALTDWLGRRL